MIRAAVFFESAIIIAGLLFIVFQIIVPFARGTPFFPLLRSKRAQAIDSLTEATEEQEINAIKTAAAGLRVAKSSTVQSKKGAN